MTQNSFIYLDNNSTTQIDPKVLDVMMPYFTENYGNASSSHNFGVHALDGVKKSRNQIAQLIGADSTEIYFTSGATESINIALKSVLEYSIEKNPHVITSSTEHPAVLDTCRFLETKGVKVTYLKVMENGLVDLVEFQKSITENTVLACIMLVNNETGVIQPIKKLAEIAHKENIWFMSDGTQAVGKVPVSVYELGIDILCFSGHKFYAPKGIGGLFIRSKRPFKPKVFTLQHGGGHERGIRSGTLNVPGIVGIGEAAEISLKQMKSDADRIISFRDKLENSLLQISNTSVNGTSESRIYNTSNICFEGADADAIVVGLKFIAVSNGSACSSTSVEPSHVLKAMGITDQQAFSSIRFSLGRFTTEKDIIDTIIKVRSVVTELREMIN